MATSPRCPKLQHEDEWYLDWFAGHFSKLNNWVVNTYWSWKPPMKKQATNPWAVPVEERDVSEFRHMLGSGSYPSEVDAGYRKDGKVVRPTANA